MRNVNPALVASVVASLITPSIALRAAAPPSSSMAPVAPQTLGNIAGKAVTTTAQPVQGASVTLINPATGQAVVSPVTNAAMTGATNAAGGFTLTGVPAGTYTVQITALVNGVPTVVGTTAVTVT